MLEQLNFTDSTAAALSDTSFPQSIDFQAFDITKGSLQVAGNIGIMFNIDSLEEFDPNAPTLTTGFHVAWPSDAKGYALEEAESVNGPWVRHNGTPLVVEGQNIVVMDLQSRSKFYRLTKAN